MSMVTKVFKGLIGLVLFLYSLPIIIYWIAKDPGKIDILDKDKPTTWGFWRELSVDSTVVYLVIFIAWLIARRGAI